MKLAQDLEGVDVGHGRVIIQHHRTVRDVYRVTFDEQRGIPPSLEVGSQVTLRLEDGITLDGRVTAAAMRVGQDEQRQPYPRLVVIIRGRHSFAGRVIN